MSDAHNVVVTGLGIVSPLGHTRDDTWDSLLACKSGAAPITAFDASQLAVQFAAEVKNLDLTAVLGKKLTRQLDRFAQLALVASDEAMADSGLEVTDPTRVSAIFGTGLGGLITIEEEHKKLLERGPGRVSPFFVPRCMPNAVSGQVAIRHGLQGPNFSTASACAASAHALAMAAMMIRSGLADAVLTGGSEAIISPLGLTGFIQIKALSRRNDDPERASRPFDVNRDGFVCGEGAGALVLESEASAKARGARIYARFAGVGMTDDAYHITAPTPSGEGAARAMREALQAAGWNTDEVDYINCHGTSTPLNDRMETEAVRTVFGDATPTTPISSTKSSLGHLIGAAGGVEAALTCLALHRGVLPATINCDQLDPECGPVDVVPNTPREAPVRRALSNSFGFGGHNISLAFARDGSA